MTEKLKKKRKKQKIPRRSIKRYMSRKKKIETENERQKKE